MSNTDFKNILSCKPEEALDFFMDKLRFSDIEMPDYFDFQPLLDEIREKIADRPFEECAKSDPQDLDDVCLTRLQYKDGQFAVRPLTILNPFLYYFLCRTICAPDNWSLILKAFKAYRQDNISACAIAIIPEDKEKEKFNKASIILNWWQSVEQRSLELSLQYSSMFITDITNCYGSIDLNTIKTALCRDIKTSAKGKLAALADDIILYVRRMQGGRTIGLPQGSQITDLIAEIVLGYADLRLHQAIEKLKQQNDDNRKELADYHIIRYRDDYRIFSNSSRALQLIALELQKVLESLNFRMNSSKTKISSNLAIDSIKPDKIDYIYNIPIISHKRSQFDGLQKHLLYILVFAQRHPNAGQLKRMLNEFYERLEKRLGTDDETPSGKARKDKTERIFENKKAMIAIATQIAAENVSVLGHAALVIHKLLEDIADEADRHQTAKMVASRLRRLRNTDFSQVWLQFLTRQSDIKDNRHDYDLPLCQLAMGQKVQPWNNKWLKTAFASIDMSQIVVTRRFGNPKAKVRILHSTPYDDDFPDDDEDFGKFELSRVLEECEFGTDDEEDSVIDAFIK